MKFARLASGGRWIRTIGPWRHAVGSVMENVDNLAEPAGRLSQSTTLRGCYVPVLVKGSMAWLLSLPVGQAFELPLDPFFLSARDQRFESVSLQRRVRCELAPADRGSGGNRYSRQPRVCRQVGAIGRSDRRRSPRRIRVSA